MAVVFRLLCIFFFVLLLVLKHSKRVSSFISTRLCVSVCVLALYVVCLSVSSLSLWRDTDRDTDISHRTTKKVKNAARVYLCMPILLFPPSLSLSLSLSRKLAWHNNFRQRVFCPKNESKTFPCGFNKCILCGAKKYATVFICSLLWPQIPHTAELACVCLCLCVFLCVCARVRVCRGVGRE